MAQLYKYGVTGPSQVMWNEDDEIKKEMGTLTRAVTEDADNVLIYRGRIAAVTKRARGWCTRRNDFSSRCACAFLTDEWLLIYRISREMGMAFVEILSQVGGRGRLDGQRNWPGCENRRFWRARSNCLRAS